MARRSRMSVLKRQRELRKAEKAARKRAKRHGRPEEGLVEPKPTVVTAELFGKKTDEDENPPGSSGESGSKPGDGDPD